jgi:hypothetical protein
VCQVIGGGPVPVELAHELGNVTSRQSYAALWTLARCLLSQEHSARTAGAASGSSTTTSTHWPTTGQRVTATSRPAAGLTIKQRQSGTAKPGYWGRTCRTRHEGRSARGVARAGRPGCR